MSTDELGCNVRKGQKALHNVTAIKALITVIVR